MTSLPLPVVIEKFSIPLKTTALPAESDSAPL
jgi:hypothetical protein